MNAARLYLRYIGVSVRSQMQYRASFIMLTLNGFLVVFFEFAGVWALFHRFQSLRGWRLAEVGLFFGAALSFDGVIGWPALNASDAPGIGIRPSRYARNCC